ncbi:hypothetical protein MMMB2_0183 [Mycobacterium marinum MB2]|nr:hypothetical protein MMMB2_0183 [Mycobacterium marinum MB2]
MDVHATPGRSSHPVDLDFLCARMRGEMIAVDGPHFLGGRVGSLPAVGAG